MPHLCPECGLENTRRIQTTGLDLTSWQKNHCYKVQASDSYKNCLRTCLKRQFLGFTEGNSESVLGGDQEFAFLIISQVTDTSGSWVMLGKQRPRRSEIKHASI